MPRPLLTSSFALTYRKIPVLAIGRDIYCDTSLIAEALEKHPSLLAVSQNHPSIYPLDSSSRSTRTLCRLLGSHYTDRPWFRIMTGLVPGAVWRTHFGTDRSSLIGHPLDAEKLERKIPGNLASLERDLSILEPLFVELGVEGRHRWWLNTPTPSMADINLYFMLDWGREIARGVGIEDLTGGESKDLQLEGIETLFNENRFPGVWRWFNNVKEYFGNLKTVENERIERDDKTGQEKTLHSLQSWEHAREDIPVLPTPQPWNENLDAKSGIMVGMEVSIAPDDTGRNNPVLGTLIKISAEEVVIRPKHDEQKPVMEAARVHFPRLGFVVRPLGRQSKL